MEQAMENRWKGQIKHITRSARRTREDALIIVKQFSWGSKLSCFSMVHHQHLVSVDDCVQPMCYDDDGTGGEFLIDGMLDERICVCVNRGCCFIQADDL